VVDRTDMKSRIGRVRRMVGDLFLCKIRLLTIVKYCAKSGSLGTYNLI